MVCNKQAGALDPAIQVLAATADSSMVMPAVEPVTVVILEPFGMSMMKLNCWMLPCNAPYASNDAI